MEIHEIIAGILWLLIVIGAHALDRWWLEDQEDDE